MPEDAPCDFFPLEFAGATSRRLVKDPSSFGISMSTSISLETSMIISPPMDQPAVPYPPALTEGDRECFEQNRTILQGGQNWYHSGKKREITYLLTSSASKGQTTALAIVNTFPLKMVE